MVPCPLPFFLSFCGLVLVNILNHGFLVQASKSAQWAREWDLIEWHQEFKLILNYSAFAISLQQSSTLVGTSTIGYLAIRSGHICYKKPFYDRSCWKRWILQQHIGKETPSRLTSALTRLLSTHIVMAPDFFFEKTTQGEVLFPWHLFAIDLPLTFFLFFTF